MVNTLPQSNLLNVQALSRTFEHTTNSYKLLFFRALLSTIESNKSINIDPIEIVNHMLAHAWVPSIHYKLSLGSQDMVFKNLTELDLIKIDLVNAKGTPYQHLLNAIQNKEKTKTITTLLKYVPYRLLQPFFSHELKGITDHKKNKLTSELSIDKFNATKPLYKIEMPTGKQLIKITLHPEWFEYLIKNLTIIKGWVELNWLQYLQTRNPNSPAISNKLALPLKRETLTKQRLFWNQYIEEKGLNCIFSNEIITIKNYQLDHFIPWTFVAHNQHWNLIPILDAVNTSKSNNLPAKGALIDLFVDVQYHAISFAKQHNKSKVLEDYLVALQCNERDLLNPVKFKIRFKQIIESLIDSATIQGFESNWNWQASIDK